MPRFRLIRFTPRLAVALAAFGFYAAGREVGAADHAAVRAAIESITADDARGYVNFLADDTLEGRAAGSRGGHAAAHYLVDHMEKLGLKPAGDKNGFYQSFLGGDNNLLGMLEGSDPELKQQIVLIGAHYDHVGYGNARNSYGPIGQIHNGADDNASGVAGLLEMIRAFTKLEPRPRRSILFAFWDGEEAGLLGSKHWVANPTVPLSQIVMAINMDMIGRLKNDTLTVYGARSTAGMRRLVSEQNDLGLILDFNWDIRGDSDHSTFFHKGIPVLMLFTGLHSDYHRPTDDAEKINAAGMERVAQLLFKCALEIADRPAAIDFRKASTGESTWTRASAERLLPALPQRLGVSFDNRETAQGQVIISRVDSGSPAAKAKLRARDRVLRVGENEVTSLDEARRAIATAASPVTFQIERAGEELPLEIVVELIGEPARLGIAWRSDDAEPGAVMLNRVVPGSPAEQAGLKPRDRIYRVAGHDFATADEFGQLVREQTAPFDVTLETAGQMREVTITPGATVVVGEHADP